MRTQEIVQLIQLPAIPDFEIKLELQNGDEIHEQVMNAIDECANRGGGRVIIPAGSFRCNGPIHLKSHIELHLSDGSFIKFSQDPERYLPQVLTRWEGIEIWNYSPIIYGRNLTDIAITGKGVLAAGSEIWRLWLYQQDSTVEKMRSLEKNGIPVANRVFGPEEHLRPSMIQFIESTRILIEDITITDAPFWMLHPVYCSHLSIRRLYADSRFLNNDGIDLDSCEYALVEDSIFRNGDDAVVIKSGRDQDGLRVNRPTRHVVVQNCRFVEVMHGFAIGSELSGGAEDIHVENIQMEHVEREALCLKSSKGRGGTIRDIHIENINVKYAGRHLLSIHSNYCPVAYGDALTTFDDISLKNIRCHYAKTLFQFQGREDRPLGTITIENLLADKADVIFEEETFAPQLHFSNVQVDGQDIQ